MLVRLLHFCTQIPSLINSFYKRRCGFRYYVGNATEARAKARPRAAFKVGEMGSGGVRSGFAVIQAAAVALPGSVVGHLGAGASVSDQ